MRDTANQQPDGEGDSAKPVVRTAADSSCEPPPPPSTGHRRKRPREERKGKKKHKRPRPPPTPVPEETDLDRFLEDTAEKNNLTVQNVKNIIRVSHFSSTSKIKVPSWCNFVNIFISK